MNMIVGMVGNIMIVTIPERGDIIIIEREIWREEEVTVATILEEREDIAMIEEREEGTIIIIVIIVRIIAMIIVMVDRIERLIGGMNRHIIVIPMLDEILPMNNSNSNNDTMKNKKGKEKDDGDLPNDRVILNIGSMDGMIGRRMFMEGVADMKNEHLAMKQVVEEETMENNVNETKFPRWYPVKIRGR